MLLCSRDNSRVSDPADRGTASCCCGSSSFREHQFFAARVLPELEHAHHCLSPYAGYYHLSSYASQWPWRASSQVRQTARECLINWAWDTSVPVHVMIVLVFSGPISKTISLIRNKLDVALSTSTLYPTREEVRQWRMSFESLLNHKCELIFNF